MFLSGVYIGFLHTREPMKKMARERRPDHPWLRVIAQLRIRALARIADGEVAA
jgi:hypothetical protein